MADEEKHEGSVMLTDTVDKTPDRASNLCHYSQCVCNLEKLRGFDFCHKHILEDKASPFKPCDFVAKSNGKRCPNPAPKLSEREKSYCIIHTRKAELRRAVEQRRKRRKHSATSVEDYEGREYSSTKRRRTCSTASSHKSVDEAQKDDGHSSEEDNLDSDEEDLQKVDSAWHGDVDSDADSLNSDEEDPLKHAGVWTVEEAARICRDKMVRLRSLYVGQFKRLQHTLKEKRRKYLHLIQAEEEDEHGECHLAPSQLLGRRHYREHHGAEALLHKQAREKRLGTSRHQNLPHLKCTHSTDGVRCSEKILPMTKFCQKHILDDPHQLLYHQCSFVSAAGKQCEKLVPQAFVHSTCSLHMTLPELKRPDIKKDLQEAKDRERLRKLKALEEKKQEELQANAAVIDVTGNSTDPLTELPQPLAEIPPATLQQKSSALVPPAGTSKDNSTVDGGDQQSSTPAPVSAIMKETPECPDTEPMDLDSSVESKQPSTEKADVPAAPTDEARKGSPFEAGERISPSLAAASLVAVCSSPRISPKMLPLTSSSGTLKAHSTAITTTAAASAGHTATTTSSSLDENAAVASTVSLCAQSVGQSVDGTNKVGEGESTAVASNMSAPLDGGLATGRNKDMAGEGGISALPLVPTVSTSPEGPDASEEGKGLSLASGTSAVSAGKPAAGMTDEGEHSALAATAGMSATSIGEPAIGTNKEPAQEAVATSVQPGIVHTGKDTAVLVSSPATSVSETKSDFCNVPTDDTRGPVTVPDSDTATPIVGTETNTIADPETVTNAAEQKDEHTGDRVGQEAVDSRESLVVAETPLAESKQSISPDKSAEQGETETKMDVVEGESGAPIPGQ